MKGEIHIENLWVSTTVGVPEEERASPQELAICLTMVPERAKEVVGRGIFSSTASSGLSMG